MIQISHEVPISLLQLSKTINDYEYCLVHLLDQNETYRDFYVNSVKEGRKVLLDNSLFELETLFNGDVFAQKILELKPTEYIIPDSLENINETINSYNNFISKYNDLPGIKIGVVQGKDLNELVECYKFMSDKADKIAISFDYSFYNQLHHSNNTLENWCYGRCRFVKYLIESNIWNYNKPHHLLGCSLAKEFKFQPYKDIIETIDTSNPIVSGIYKLKYDKDGLNEKPKMKLYELIDYIPDESQLDIIKYNAKMFRDIVNNS